MGKVRNRLEVINAMARKWTMMSSRLPSLLTVGVPKGKVANVDVEAEVMMSGGVVDVEPSLISRNTLGIGNRNSKFQTKLG